VTKKVVGVFVRYSCGLHHATPEGWRIETRFSVRFYNQRRKQLKEVEPNRSYISWIEKVLSYIITQNVDDLRTPEVRMLHLHGN
jgi:NAD-dependent deacetylase